MKSNITATKSMRRTSSVQKMKVPKVPSGIAKEKSSKSTSWGNIFEVSKIRISFSPRDLDFNQVRIRSVSPAFTSTFGFDMGHAQADEEGFRPLSVLFGKSTNRDFPFLVENTLLTGQSAMEYVNLYRSDREVLSCHVTVRSVPSGDQARQDMQELQHSDERWAVLTIRSASSLGNANFIGVGLLGVERIAMSQLERLIGGDVLTVPEIDQLLSSNASNSTGQTY